MAQTSRKKSRRPTSWLKRLTRLFVVGGMRALPPDKVLRFLFRLDHWLYYLEGQMAIVYGGGIHTKHRHMRYHDFFTKRIGSRERVLDIGCGNGALTYDIAQATEGEVVGIDISVQNIAQAQAAYSRSNLRFLVGDATRDVPDGPFDTLVLSNVWEHIEERVTFMRRLLAATGAQKVLIRVPMFEREWMVPLKKELGVEWRLDHTHHTEYTEEQLRREIAESGLVLQEMIVRWGEFWCRCGVDQQQGGGYSPRMRPNVGSKDNAWPTT